MADDELGAFLRGHVREEGRDPGLVVDDQILAYVACVQAGRLTKPSCCRWCGRSGCLRWHGTYLRTLISLARTYVLPVKRVLCAVCRRTLAHLPVFVGKCHRYARGLIRQALRMLRAKSYDAAADWFVEQGQRFVAILTLYFWRQKFARS